MMSQGSSAAALHASLWPLWWWPGRAAGLRWHRVINPEARPHVIKGTAAVVMHRHDRFMKTCHGSVRGGRQGQVLT